MQHPKNLYELVDFDKGLKDIDFSGVVEVVNGKEPQLLFKNDGKKYYAPIKNQFIHQLLARMYGEIDIKTAIKEWKENASSANFIAELNNSLKHRGIKLRTFSRNNENHVYGLVSNRFRHIDQLEFRDKLYQAFLNNGIKVNGTLKGTEERFDLPVYDNEVSFELVISYARNNGYHGYRSEWERIIRICSNGLKRTEAESSHLIHHAEVDFNKFINKLIEHGVYELGEVGKHICVAKSKELTVADFNPLFSRLLLAEGVKERIIAKYTEEVKLYGNTEWSLSQAFTWMGTHDKYTYPGTRALIQETGTTVLEISLQSYLNNKSYLVTEKSEWGDTFRSLLPNGHKGISQRNYWKMAGMSNN